MGALSFLTTVFAPPESQVKVSPRRCLRNRLRGNRCDLCLQICPSAALSYSGGSLHFAEHACTSCMACTAVCPVDALVPIIDLQQFVDHARSAEHDTLIISCSYNRLFGEDELLLPCLGLLSPELLTYMASALPQKTLRFNVRRCSDCRNLKVSSWFQKNLNSLVQHGGSAWVTKMELSTADSGEQTQDDRRSFFKAMRRDAVNAAAFPQAAKGQIQQEQAPTSRTIPSKTALLKTILESDEPQHPLATRMAPRLSIGANCHPCPRCAGICPTGALKLVRQKQGKIVKFDSTSCCSCALCVDFCKEGSLALSCTLKI